MKLSRRQFLYLAAGAAALPAISRVAWAQAYPTRPVSLVAGFVPGGGVVSASPIADMLPSSGGANPSRWHHRHRGIHQAGSARHALKMDSHNATPTPILSLSDHRERPKRLFRARTKFLANCREVDDRSGSSDCPAKLESLLDRPVRYM